MDGQDRVHLPAILKLREPFESGERLAKRDITISEETVTGASNCSNDINRPRVKGRRDIKTGIGIDQQTIAKKRGSVLDRQRTKLSTKLTTISHAASKTERGSGSEGSKNRNFINARRRNEAISIGLPNISLTMDGDNVGNDNDSQRTAAKKPRRCRRVRGVDGDTISYVYSKSLKDENCMAFLRNCSSESEEGVSTSCLPQRSSASAIDTTRKPYGLPSLKGNGECIDEKDDLTLTTEEESLLNNWEMDDDVSNATNCDSSNFLPRNE